MLEIIEIRNNFNNLYQIIEKNIKQNKNYLIIMILKKD